MNTITINEDQALGKGTTIEHMLEAYKAEGYHIQHEYHHPAVGRVITLCNTAFNNQVEQPDEQEEWDKSNDEDTDWNYYEYRA